MSWIRLDIPCPTEIADLAAAIVLAETGRGAGIVDGERATVVQAWILEDDLREMGGRLRRSLAAAGAPLAEAVNRIEQTTVADEEWDVGWRRHFKPLRAGNRLVVNPSWEEWPPADQPDAGRPDDLIIEIDPGGAFGTGTHPSTQLALGAIERALRTGESLIDVGCGSGILSMAGALLGASRVIAIDFDRAAVDCTLRNLHDQGMADRTRVLVADGLSALRERADVIAANITADAVIAVGQDVGAHLNDGGRYIAGGFVDDSVPTIGRALGGLGLRVRDADHLDGWACLTLVAEEGGSA